MDPRIFKTIAISFLLWILLAGPLVLVLSLEAMGKIPSVSETISSNPAYLLALVPGVVLLIKRAITGKFI